jgi:hypothetical protein
VQLSTPTAAVPLPGDALTLPDGFAYNPALLVMLRDNYRSHEGILALPSRWVPPRTPLAVCMRAVCVCDRKHVRERESAVCAGDCVGRLFYHNMLVGRAAYEVTHSLEAWEYVSTVTRCPVVWFGVRGDDYHKLDSPSFVNVDEVVEVCALVEALVFDSFLQVQPEDVGVICAFWAQVWRMRLELRERGLGAVRVGVSRCTCGRCNGFLALALSVNAHHRTCLLVARGQMVHDFQGQESRVTVISTVSACHLAPSTPVSLWPDRLQLRCRHCCCVIDTPTPLCAPCRYCRRTTARLWWRSC